ncbi:hypothetical protein [Dyadobacter crusticola]|uniref:hypothetical protein n=1 Tax=Dyadobacter crusticola TaxID=292407 RepID=UPI0004E126FC|nr:hypothetical protein [Dyadobacter crusticola]
MGLDMRPLGKPKPGFEQRFAKLFFSIRQNEVSKPTFIDRLIGKKHMTKDKLLEEWFSIQIPAYETIKAPKVGRDKEADEWIRHKNLEADNPISENELIKQYEGFYVIELAVEQDGVPVYISPQQDANVFRGQFLSDCEDLIGEDLVNEAWTTKLADATLDYGNRLLVIADKIADENNLRYIKDQRLPPDVDEDTIESKLHIVYSLAKWLIFYGKNGHGYEADF